MQKLKNNRSCLGGTCDGLERTPVDYAFKPNGWPKNPHWTAGSKYQPLEFGRIDLLEDATRLGDGELFKQYENSWVNTKEQNNFIVNDSKNRFDLTNEGHYLDRQRLDNQGYNPSFDSRRFSNTPTSSYANKLYSGSGFFF